MKLRIQESSIVLRLLPQEIEALDSGTLSQKTTFPGGELEIRVEAKPINDMEFYFEDQVYSFSIPKDEIVSWSTSNKIGFRHNYDDLMVVVEKDLPRRKKQ